jgi:putative SOS response-associated peptidase YedK
MPFPVMSRAWRSLGPVTPGAVSLPPYHTPRMCGRFALTREERELAREFVELNPRIQIARVEPRYNIAPTQPVLALHVAGQQVQAHEFRWGIELPWARTARQKSQINIRGETALKPGLLRRMLDRQRVLIPASHFYEWQARPGASRQPILIAPKQGEGLVFAGLLGRWTNEATGEMLPAVTILTTSPNPLLSRIHNRMPVILDSASWSRWLDPENTAKDVAVLLNPCPEDWLTVYPISARINNVANDGPALIEPLTSHVLDQ